MDSTPIGFSLDFVSKENYEDSFYKFCIIKFIIFHILFSMFIISLIRTVLVNPGFFEKEYVFIYQIF